MTTIDCFHYQVILVIESIIILLQTDRHCMLGVSLLLVLELYTYVFTLYFNSLSEYFQGTLCAARRAAAFVRGDDVIHKLFTELAYRYK